MNATNVNDFLNGKVSFGMMGDAETKRVDDEVQRMLIARSPAGTKLGKMSDVLNISPTAREQDICDRIGRIKAAGGQPLDAAPNEAEVVSVQRGGPNPGEQKGVVAGMVDAVFGDEPVGFFAPPSTPEEWARQMPKPGFGLGVVAAPGAKAAVPDAAEEPGIGMAPLAIRQRDFGGDLGGDLPVMPGLPPARLALPSEPAGPQWVGVAFGGGGQDLATFAATIVQGLLLTLKAITENSKAKPVAPRPLLVMNRPPQFGRA